VPPENDELPKPKLEPDVPNEPPDTDGLADIPELPSAVDVLGSPPPTELLLPIPVPRLVVLPEPENALPLLTPAEEPLPNPTPPAGPELPPIPIPTSPAPCKLLVSQSRLLAALVEITLPRSPTIPFPTSVRSMLSWLCKGGVELSKEHPTNRAGKTNSGNPLFMAQPQRNAAAGQ